MKKLLLHTCCAPCSIVIVDELKSQYDLTVFFYNPNIHPEEEYLKRKKEVMKVCDEWGVKMLDMDYDVEKWHETVKGFEQEPEGEARCAQCFSMRLKRSAEYASQRGYDIFATSLSSGRNKKALLINGIAQHHAKNVGLAYLSGDWKKGGRQEKGRQMIMDRDIYRQDYCGCIYSHNT